MRKSQIARPAASLAVDQLPFGRSGKARAKYPEYRDSGIFWLGEIPSHWKVIRTKYVADLKTGHTPSRQAAEYWIDCTIPWFSLADVWQLRDGRQKYLGQTAEMISELGLKNSAAELLPAGTVIVSRTASIGFSGIMPIPMATTQDFVNWVCGPRLIPDFLLWVFRAMRPEFDRLVQGSTHKTIYMPDAHRFETPVPPLDEQREIADFLDRETAKIDDLIASKQAMLDRLAERRAVFVSQTVTWGVAPAGEGQETGIEWLPSIPEGWKLKRLKYVADLQTGLTLGKKYGEGAELVTRPYLRVANVQDGYLDLTQLTSVELPPSDAARYELLPGDVLMTEGGDFDKLGRGYVWDSQIEGCLHQNHIFAVRPHEQVLDSHFLSMMLSSMHGKNYFTSTAQKTTNLASTNSTKLRAFPVPVPPIDEQRTILDFVRAGCRLIDQAADAVAVAIGKLQEHRFSLISAAVAGQIAVRQYRPEAPCP